MTTDMGSEGTTRRMFADKPIVLHISTELPEKKKNLRKVRTGPDAKAGFCEQGGIRGERENTRDDVESFGNSDRR